MPSNNPDNVTVSFGMANVGALITTLPICAAFLWGYIGLFGWEAIFLPLLSAADILVIMAVIVVGIVAHEGIHALSWSWFDGIPRRHIHFGFKWSTITPYVHCDVPITTRNYRWGTAMPGIILGFLPSFAAMATQNIWMLYFGLIFTMAAGGDFLILWLLRKIDADTMVQDHPELIGCQVVNSNQHS
ncbi:DUF3267 domain-containing protein [Fodinibius sp. Rm-B-1B1-1]|uniref:DUF3267 domain-containing protein n=1 Tax=Fodinibius alkaliphilus TaxID=3140241 RepID=UPI003159C544